MVSAGLEARVARSRGGVFDAAFHQGVVGGGVGSIEGGDVGLGAEGRGEGESAEQRGDRRTFKSDDDIGQDVRRIRAYWTGVISRPSFRSRLVVALRATVSVSERPLVISACVRLTMPNWTRVRTSLF